MKSLFQSLPTSRSCLQRLGRKCAAVGGNQPRFADARPYSEMLTGAVSASQGMLQRDDLAPKDPVAPMLAGYRAVGEES
jgi:hypothetical protein